MESRLASVMSKKSFMQLVMICNEVSVTYLAGPTSPRIATTSHHDDTYSNATCDTSVIDIRIVCFYCENFVGLM
jgi:hypothetical protein